MIPQHGCIYQGIRYFERCTPVAIVTSLLYCSSTPSGCSALCSKQCCCAVASVVQHDMCSFHRLVSMFYSIWHNQFFNVYCRSIVYCPASRLLCYQQGLNVEGEKKWMVLLLRCADVCIAVVKGTLTSPDKCDEWKESIRSSRKKAQNSWLFTDRDLKLGVP